VWPNISFSGGPGCVFNTNMSTSRQDGYRWASVTPDDYSGALYVATFLSFTYTSTTVLARVLIKSNMLGADDGTMVAAQVCLLLP
jgi:hypothetical protein